MVGIPDNIGSDGADDSVGDSAHAEVAVLEGELRRNKAASDGANAEAGNLVTHIKKRKLYRPATGTEIVWFPHDNAPELLKECVWESDVDDLRWVLHGTPAGGAGVAGVLETGASVVCLCEDTHHKTHFQQFLRERCVEALLAGSNVFDNKSLKDRASELLPHGPPKAGEKDKEKDSQTKENHGKHDENQVSKAEGKATKNKTKGATGGKIIENMPQRRPQRAEAAGRRLRQTKKRGKRTRIETSLARTFPRWAQRRISGAA